MAMRCLIGCPVFISAFASCLLDISTFCTIKSRNLQNHPNSNQPNINNIIGFHLLNNTTRKKCLETSIRSTTISITLFLFCFPFFILGNLLGMSPFYTVALPLISYNVIRIPLIVSLAVKRNETNTFQSRATRQQWEMTNALEERKKRREERQRRSINVQMETSV